MKVYNYLDTEAVEDAPGILRRVVIGADDGAPTFIMRVFEIKAGGSTPLRSTPIHGNMRFSFCQVRG